MKTIKLFILALVSSMTFLSCSDSNSVNSESKTGEKSIALRTVLNEFKLANDIHGKNVAHGTTVTDNPFCFDFVYPITFTYNNGTNITVTSLDGLIVVLSNESPNLYLEGIVFPFQVVKMIQNATTTLTINNENDFFALLESCGFTTIDDDLQNTFCFDIVFPITVTSGNQNVTIATLQELQTYMNNPANGNQTQIVFPISVIYNNQTVVVNNLYEFYAMINNCDSCICSQEYAPVCVQTPAGTVEYGNMCYAICAGYTQNDIVNCGSNTNCSITNAAVTVGACNTDGTYSLTINFAYSNTSATSFEIHNSNNTLIGTYPLTALPLTINEYSSLNISEDILTISIGNNCSQNVQWSVPNCGGNTGGFSSQLGTCFTIQYPVTVIVQGTTGIAVNSNSELLNYYYPTMMGSMPAMVYPITVTFNGQNTPTTFTFQNQSEFETKINALCN